MNVASGNKPNILLVILDSVRAQNTSLYRDDRDTTPRLRQFASRATLYENAIAPGTASLQSHASIFTGLHVVEHRINSRQAWLGTETIWDILSATGYSLGVFSHNPYLTEVPVGFDQPFDYVFSGNPRNLPFPDAADTRSIQVNGLMSYISFLKKLVLSQNRLKSLLNGIAAQADNTNWIPYSLATATGHEITEGFAKWHEQQDTNWAACLNYMDAHSPYVSSPQHNKYASAEERELAATLDDYVWRYVSGEHPLSELQSLENPYDDCIRQADAAVGKLLQLLKERDDLENTLIVITADHGEGFGEDGTIRSVPSIGHGGMGGPEEGVLRVPLLVQYPEQTEKRTIQRPASTTRFPKTVRAVLNDQYTGNEFIPDEYVLASSLGVSQPELDPKPAHVTDISKYNREARVVYQWTDNRELLKHILYGDNSFTFDVTIPTEIVSKSSTEARDIVKDAFSELDQVEQVQNKQTEQIDQDVKKRLEDLGYK